MRIRPAARLAPFLLLALLPAGALPAQEPSAPAWFDAMIEAEGQAWEEVRESVLARFDVVALARAMRGGAPYGPANWRRLVLAEALAMHVTHPEEAEALRNLEGLDSDNYLRGRVPAPSVTVELDALRHAAPLMIEMFLKGVAGYAWSSPAAAEAEESALRRDLLLAVGVSGHPASVHFLADVVDGGCACCESCGAAVRALGETGALQALPALLRARDRARGEGDVEGEAAAVAALGGVRHVETWPHIAAGLEAAGRRVREAAIRGAGTWASRRYWRDDPARGARIRAEAGASLTEALLDAEDEGLVVAVLESMTLMATPGLRDELDRRRRAATGPAEAAASTAAPAGERLLRALERVERTLAGRGPDVSERPRR